MDFILIYAFIIKRKYVLKQIVYFRFSKKRNLYLIRYFVGEHKKEYFDNNEHRNCQSKIFDIPRREVEV